MAAGSGASVPPEVAVRPHAVPAAAAADAGFVGEPAAAGAEAEPAAARRLLPPRPGGQVRGGSGAGARVTRAAAPARAGAADSALSLTRAAAPMTATRANDPHYGLLSHYSKESTASESLKLIYVEVIQHYVTKL